MKKLIIHFLLLLFPLSVFAWAPISPQTNTENSDVIASVESWTFDKVIDVKLIANDDGAKVFYYTDKVWRFDEQIEYKLWSVITIKKDTTLNYYSASKNETASLIKENIYRFNYPEKIHLWYNWNALVITNNENKEIDLRWWTINWNEILYKTIVEISWKYNFPFHMNSWDIATLSSPDEKVKIAFKYLLKKDEPSIKTNNEISKVQENINSKNSINSLENIKTWTETNTEDQTEENILTWVNNELNWNIEETTNSNLQTETSNLNNNLKTSIIDSKPEKKTNPLVLLAAIIIIIWIAWWVYIKLEKK